MLGKYKLLRHLGKGGMSQVYLAEHTLMKRKVAIKVLPQNRVEDSTYLERFRIEARAAAKLDDPNIVRVVRHRQRRQDALHRHGVRRRAGPARCWCATRARCRTRRRPTTSPRWPAGWRTPTQMGLVHRDIKPANCLLDKHEMVKLLDMGLARLIDDEASLTLDNNENVLGTADYLAPEQALNSHKADARADIYSLGCTLYFLLTGHPPFPDGTISERLLKHQVEQAPSIFKDRPDAPSVLVNICNRMMAKRPDERYQTAGEVAERLAEWLGDRGIEVGDSGKKSGRGGGSGGIGSDVFRRFAASMQKAGGDSGRPAKGSGGRKLAGGGDRDGGRRAGRRHRAGAARRRGAGKTAERRRRWTTSRPATSTWRSPEAAIAAQPARAAEVADRRRVRGGPGGASRSRAPCVGARANSIRCSRRGSRGRATARRLGCLWRSASAWWR